MCLGIPGKVVEWLDHDPVVGRALVEFDGVRRACHMACVPEAGEGDYVIVHVGYAISRLDADEALRTLALFAGVEPVADAGRSDGAGTGE